MTQDDQRSLFERALSDFYTGRGLAPGALMQRWFSGRGGAAYLFLFKKGLDTTNMQNAELLALLQLHTRSVTVADAPGALHFMSRRQFKETIRAFLDVKARRQQSDDWVTLVTDLHWDSIRRTLVVEAYRGTTIVQVPPTLTVDLARVCAEAGYVHSCGPLVWARNVNKARMYSEDVDIEGEKETALVPALDGYLAGHEGRGKRRLFFSAYAHEDFTEHDRTLSSELSHGLDDVKVYVEKFYLGDRRLSQAMADIRNLPDLQSHLAIPRPGPFYKQHLEMREAPDVHDDSSMFLLVDRGIDRGAGATPERYYLCYDQHYINHNPYHYFDENKPAWRAHTTLPHTLAGAMINLARPMLPPEARMTDPFAGTGTTLFEAAKLDGFAQVRGSDIEPFAVQLMADNQEFFSLAADELDDYRRRLLDLCEAVSAADDDAARPEVAEWAHQLAEDVASDVDSDLDLGEGQLAELRDRDLFDRMVFYVALRAARRDGGRPGSDRRTGIWAVWTQELESLDRQIRRLWRERKRSPKRRHGNITVVDGEYSESLSFDADSVRRSAFESVCAPVEELEGPWDLIVFDPPYGFNTDDDSALVAQLYHTTFKRVLQALDEGGQMVVSLPDRSYTGREAPRFAQAQVVRQQIHTLAEELGLELVDSPAIRPEPDWVFDGPLYWEAEKALRRSILRFRVRSRAAWRARQVSREGGTAP